ncbi:AAA family ATPase [Methylobacterium isbiliense]|jgi:succinoglycan biosynthesis transport protein ExoP|uniref:non-specific protein-tyrosine kinase n=1 Tax=Methylobacterium isbiliense TaxID=315478 RepID=A0ABQ4SNT4_9HYPH|nr:AAA family ATPase [Methylobacterium isbiliense]MDN3626799.1 AAA family ATPase [Methylobacterium isbiliense]GJE04093.1 Iron-sulfur cluster carrier protein [Methylobacterium isbiliense]
MTYIDQDLALAPYPGRGASGPTLQNEIRAVLALLRRRLPLILACALLGGIVFTVFAYTATPLYRASAEISVDPRRLSVLDTKDERRRQEPVFDPARVDSLVETVRSERITRAVVADLNLDEDPEFNGTRPGTLARLTAWITGEAPDAPSPAERRQAAVEAVAGGLSAARVENTFVMEVRFLAETPEKAARVANGFAQAFLRDQIQANSDTTQQAAGWLKKRLDDLAREATRAEAAVAAYKRQNNIATADGKSIDDQALASISTMLTEAAGTTATAQAKLDRVVAVNRAATPDLAVADALTNEVITKVRQQYLETTSRASELASRFGEEHPVVKRLRGDAANMMESMRSELRRIEEVYRSDLEIARKREAALRQSLDEQFRKTSDIGAHQVRLQELESTARTARQAYEDYAQRYIQTVQRETFPVSEARLIAEATPPTKKFSPKRTLLMGLGLVGGGALGLLLGFGVDFADRSLRTRREAAEAVGCDCLGFIPAARDETGRQGAGDPAGQGRKAAPGLAWDHVLRQPFSIGAETLRAIRVAADQAHEGRGVRCIGVVSCLPGEGKTSVSANLARLIARSGRRVLLIDGDLRNPTLTRGLAPEAVTGLADALDGADLGAAVQGSADLSLDFLPATTGGAQADAYEILGSPAMRALLAEARERYDYLVVDLPPMMPVTDVRALASSIDAFVLVIEWGATSRELVADALRSAPVVWDRLLGTVLNKARLKQLKRYGEAPSTYYHERYIKA